MNDIEFSTIAQNASVSPVASIMHPVNFARFVEVHALTSVGKFSFINQYSVVYGRTTLGKYCVVARNCEIGVANHPVDWISTLGNFKSYFPKHPDLGSSEDFHNVAHPPTNIGNDVWLGAGVTIKAGVNIGHGAIIAAGAVVVSDVEPYAIYGGIPAKFIRFRFDEEVIQDLLSLNWWDLDTAKVAALPRNNIKACIGMMKRWRAESGND